MKRSGTGHWLPLPALLEPSTRSRGRTASGHNLLKGFLVGPENPYVETVFSWLTQGVPIYTNPNDLTAVMDYIPIGTVPGLCPLVLFGPSGSGKTHLARGLASWHQKKKPRYQVFCESAVDFYRNLVEAISNGTKDDFRARITNASLVILDDIEILGTHEAGQEELLWLLDDCRDQERPVLLTASAFPKELAGFHDHLIDRLLAGTLVPLAFPGRSSRQILVRRFAEFFDVPLSDEAFACIVDEFPEAVGPLFGTFSQLALQTQDEKGFLTVPRIRQYLENRFRTKGIGIEEIARVVALFYRVRLGDMRGKSREKTLVLARNMTVWLTRKLVGMTLVELGQWFSGRDHTTILYGFRDIDQRVKTDSILHEDANQIMELINGKHGPVPF